MKFLHATLFFFIGLFAYSQVFSVNEGYSTITSHAHNNFVDGEKLDVFITESNQGSLVTILHSDALGNSIGQQAYLMSGYNVKIIGVTTYSDGSYNFVLTSYDNTYVNYCLSIVKFSSSHTLLWNKKLIVQDLNEPYFKHMAIDNGNGGVFISCSAYQYLGVINIDVNGNILWSKSYTGVNSNGKSPGFSICKNGIGGVIGTLKEDSYQCIVNIDANGQAIWAKTFFDQNYRWPSSIKQLNDGNFLIVGDFYADVITTYTYIQKVSPAGNVLFSKKINTETMQCHDMAINDNDEIYILGSDWSNYPTSVLKLDANCNVVSIKKTDKLDIVNNDYPHSFTSDSPKSFTARTSLYYKPTVIHLNDDIVSLCYSSSIDGLITTNDVAMQQAIVTTGVLVADLTVVSTNQIFTSVSEQLSIEKDDPCTELSISSIIEENDVSIYPNPALNHLTINLKDNKVESAKFIDIQGNVVFEVCKNCSGQIETEVSTLSPGIYYVVITSPDNRWVKKLVIN